MSRFLLLLILNLSLPFLIRAAWIILLKLRHNHMVRNNPDIIDVTPKPVWYFPVRKLLLAGVVLLMLSLVGWRFITQQVDTSWESSSPAISKEY